jgi:WD40 repeat protein
MRESVEGANAGRADWIAGEGSERVAGEDAAGGRYDAFISYSHRLDKALATALQSGLHRFAKPWYRLRALRVFRDDAALPAEEALWPAIAAALDQSRYLILVASPDAASSPWVDRELSYWLDRHDRGKPQVMIALSAGDLCWDLAANGFDHQRSTSLPAALFDAFPNEPRWVDLRWARDGLSRTDPRFQAAVADLAAPLHGRPKDELAGEDVTQHRRALRLARGAVAVLAVLVLFAFAAAGVALDQRSEAGRQRDDARAQRDEARRQRDVADSRRLAAEATVVREQQPDLGLLLALEAERTRPTTEASAVLQSTLSRPIHPSRELSTHREAVNRVAFSPDGSSLATASNDGTVRVWDVATGEPTMPPLEHGDAVQVVAFSPDGTLIASATIDTIHLWRADDGEPAGTIDRDPAYESDPADTEPPVVDSSWPNLGFNRDGDRLHYGADVWDIRTRGHLPSAVPNEAEDDRDPAWERSLGLNIGDFRGYVLINDLRSGSEITAVDTSAAVIDAVLLPDRPAVAIAEADEIRVHSLPGGEVLGDSITHRGVDALSVSADGSLMATLAADEATIRLWDTHTMQPLSPLLAIPGARAATFSPDGRQLAVGRGDGTVRLLTVTAQPPPVGQPVPGAVFGATFAPDGRFAAVAGDDNEDAGIAVWNLETGEAPDVIAPGHSHQSVEFSPDGTLLAPVANVQNEGTLAGEVEVWDVATERRIAGPIDEPSQTGPGPALVSRDNARLFAAGGDEVRIWTLGTEPSFETALELAGVTDIDIDTSGRFLVAGSYGASEPSDNPVVLRVWDLQDAVVVGELRQNEVGDGVHAVRFSPDGELIATAVMDGTAKLWDVPHLGPVGEPLGTKQVQPILTGGIADVAFSPDGRTLASTGDDVVNFWRIPAGTQLGTPVPLTGAGADIDFSPDGTVLAAPGGGAVHLIASPETWAMHACALAGRNLSRDEWNRYRPDTPYATQCSDHPPGHGVD